MFHCCSNTCECLGQDPWSTCPEEDRTALHALAHSGPCVGAKKPHPSGFPLLGSPAQGRGQLARWVRQGARPLPSSFVPRGQLPTCPMSSGRRICVLGTKSRQRPLTLTPDVSGGRVHGGLSRHSHLDQRPASYGDTVPRVLHFETLHESPLGHPL